MSCGQAGSLVALHACSRRDKRALLTFPWRIFTGVPRWLPRLLRELVRIAAVAGIQQAGSASGRAVFR